MEDVPQPYTNLHGIQSRRYLHIYLAIKSWFYKGDAIVFSAGTSFQFPPVETGEGDVDMMDDRGDVPQLAVMNFNTCINN